MQHVACTGSRAPIETLFGGMRGPDLESAAALALSQATTQHQRLLGEGAKLGLQDLHKARSTSLPAAQARVFDTAYDMLRAMVEVLIERVAGPLMGCEVRQPHQTY